jgi:5-methylcytosine-specific restriction endonuclease McrA
VEKKLYTLKLDAAWNPIEIIDSHKGFKMCYNGRANMVTEYPQDYPFPAVIVLKNYVRSRFMSYNCNRRNVVWRDKNVCQYCGNKFTFSELTMDHVIPKSRGGEKSWNNIVASCKKCNSKKGDRTPEEARMPLIKKPFVPRWSIQILLRGFCVPEEWEDFI